VVERNDGGIDLPPGKHRKNYGNTSFLMGKSTINGHFSIANC
jgi:putative heme iron utilization protein